MTMGMTRGTAARRPVAKINGTLGRVSTGQSYLRARNHTSTIRQTMMVAAGMKPPRNSATAEVFVTWAITIMKMAGGTSMPIAVPAAISDAESWRLYPAFVSGGIKVEPRAETSAIFEPQMSEKK